ncbi:helix-turn-helix domain-containing protein [Leisingera daeponensis]|uniref:Helix-turn-helix domain-containing protein n=1 Tax=Leisingera daeponensis TaxID=405746 RepID=A0ABS7NP83_9RHOB|nr:helix-turn-helix domain-containing protein [Leisingera daeponensis]MBY6141936.1 helix-turn-helix domain-containing protein [Leisingera daeponensis]
MKAVRVTILAEQGFVPTELALVVDVLRIATRLGSGVRFEHQVCTAQDDRLVEGLGGSLVRAVPFQTGCTALPDHLLVLGGAGIRSAFRGLKGRLSLMERMGVGLTLLSDAAAEWKCLHPDTDHITTHWENLQVDRDAGSSTESRLPLFTQKAQVATGAGMASTADLVLTRIVAPHSLYLAQSVAHVLLIGDIRDGAASQPRSENDVMSLRHGKLEPIIAAMENALETPLSIAELAEIAGFSVRQMERKFKALIGRSPASYYRFLRLRRAKALVEQTVLPITEISVACGFGSPSSFAKRYILEFGISPSKRRVQLSVGPYRHQLTSENQGSCHASLPLSPGAPRSFVHTAGAHETLVQGAGG